MSLPLIAFGAATLLAVATAITCIAGCRAAATVTAILVGGGAAAAAGYLHSRDDYAAAALAGVLSAVLVGAAGYLLAPAPRPIRRTRGACPAWCDIPHTEPSERQAIVFHERVVGAHDLIDGGTVEVRVTWLERLCGPASEPPHIVLSVHGRTTLDLEFTPDQAATFAIILAADLSGQVDGAFTLALTSNCGWLPYALAEGARRLGFDISEVTL